MRLPLDEFRIAKPMKTCVIRGQSPVDAVRLALLLVLLAAGCDRLDTRKLLGWEVATLAPKPFVLDAVGRTLESDEPMRALGASTVCVVLMTHYPLPPRAQADRDYKSRLQGANLSATLVGVDGQQFQLDSVNQAWDLEGTISSSEELSACMSSTVREVPVGTVIKSVHITSDKAVPVLGAYWESGPSDRSEPERRR